MKFQTLLLPTLTFLLANTVLAGQNCKCQADDGTGPQWNDLTEQCCSGYENINPVSKCGVDSYYPGPNHQCSASGSNCIDSGLFVTCCQNLGAPGAYCWD